MAQAALLFDLDGTVWDSWPWYATLIAGEDEDGRGEVRRALSSGTPIARLLKHAGIQETRFRGLCAGDERCALYDRVIETIEVLANLGKPMGVVTNLPAWIAEPMLAGLGLAERLPAVAYYGSTRRRKPHPDQLFFVMTQLGIAPSPASWYVGDTWADAGASEAAGLSFAWASYGYAGEVPDFDRQIDRFEEVLDL